MGNIVVITRASGGFGALTARALAEAADRIRRQLLTRVDLEDLLTVTK